MSFSIKYALTATCLTLVALLTGCSSKTLDFRNAEISNNKIYWSGANVGFSGKVTNFPMAKLPAPIMPIVKILGTVTKDGTLSKVMLDYVYAGFFGRGDPNAILCDTIVEDGVLNGDTTCKIANTRDASFKFSFKEGAMNGPLIAYAPNGSKVIDAMYARGELNGPSKILSTRTGKTLHNAMWKNGIANGLEELFDATTGNLIFSATLTNGQYDGDMNSYSADGKLIEKKILKAGVVQPSPQAAASSGVADNGCVPLWIAAYRKENGNDAIVTADQLSEWGSWCKDGRKPTAL